MTITTQQLKSIFLCACARIKGAKAELTEIDSRFGDADHGITMEKIARSMEDAIARSHTDNMQEMIGELAGAVMGVNGGSAAPLWATLLEGLKNGAPAGNVAGPDDLKVMFKASFEALQEITTATVGDKTMMDAFIPAVEAIAGSEGDMKALLKAGADAAQAGTKKSEEFVSKFGRAKSYKEQTIGTPDVGAVSMQYFFIGLYEGFTTQ